MATTNNNIDKSTESLHRLAYEALENWDVEGADLELIKKRENAVFKVETRNHKKSVLRIHRANYHTDAELSSELLWMQALQAEGIEVPQYIPTNDGKPFIVMNGDYMEQARQIDMFEWIDGDVIRIPEEINSNNLKELKCTYELVGQLAAKVHNQSTKWEIPADFTRHEWNVDGLLGENPIWGKFWELDLLTSEQRVLMEKTRGKLKQDLFSYGQALEKYSLIHADIMVDNVMTFGAHARLIDFDDCGFGWHLFELATALYFDIGTTYFDDVQASLIEGYQSVRSLSDEDIEMLPTFLVARGTTYLGWLHTRDKSEISPKQSQMYIDLVCPIADEYLSSK